MNSTDLPEKVLQFGTGVLLRGLPDYFIDVANKQGVFNGRVVVVKSMPGNTAEFESKGCQYTMCVRGTERGVKIAEDTVVASLSRVLSADNEWPAILDFAAQPDLQVILSNTTEVGMRFEAESIFKIPPMSFAAKLTAVLYHRFKKLGNTSNELIVIPTELISDNGLILAGLVNQMASYNRLSEDFSSWLLLKIKFCNSLVDRIVTKPSDSLKQSVAGVDSLTIQTEPYKLWAIEGGESVRKALTFSKVNPGVVIEENIEHFRERKLRLLNGAGTMMASLGYLSGLDTVYQCTQDNKLASFIESLMMKEIQPTLPDETSEDTIQFARDVMERWRNEFTVHPLLSITFQGTAKMKMRNVPTLMRYVSKFNSIPELLAKGFASHLLFMKSAKKEGEEYFGSRNGKYYLINDNAASYFHEMWTAFPESLKGLVNKISENKDLWGEDLTQLPMFVETVAGHLAELNRLASS